MVTPGTFRVGRGPRRPLGRAASQSHPARTARSSALQRDTPGRPRGRSSGPVERVLALGARNSGRSRARLLGKASDRRLETLSLRGPGILAKGRGRRGTAHQAGPEGPTAGSLENMALVVGLDVNANHALTPSFQTRPVGRAFLRTAPYVLSRHPPNPAWPWLQPRLGRLQPGPPHARRLAQQSGCLASC